LVNNSCIFSQFLFPTLQTVTVSIRIQKVDVKITTLYYWSSLALVPVCGTYRASLYRRYWRKFV